MPGLAIGAVALVALLVAISRAHAEGTAPAAAPAGPKAVATHVKKIVASRNPKAIAAAARVAHQAGDPHLARELASHAKAAAVTAPSATYPVPLPGVGQGPWNAFVRLLMGSDPKAISPAYQLGLFKFGMRRLVDLGLAHNPHKRDYHGRQVWDAEWAPALSPGPDKFLEDASLQYKTFARSMLALGHQIAAQAHELVGSVLDGRPVTLSGLLAVAHQAGFQGMHQWASDPKVRASFKQTTDLFHRANGLF